MAPKPRSIDHGAMDVEVVENGCREIRKKSLLTYSGGERTRGCTRDAMLWLSVSDGEEDPTEGTDDMNLTAPDCDLVAVGTS